MVRHDNEWLGSAMEQTIILTVSHKKKKMFLANELFPAGIILFTGVMSLHVGTDQLLAYVNIISGAVILFFGIKEWRLLASPEHRGFHWFDIASGAVMMVDAVIMYKPWKGFQPAMVYGALSVAIILKGFSIVKPPHVRKMVVTDIGGTIRTNIISRLEFTWAETRSVSISEQKLIVHTEHAQKSISLRSIGNMEELISHLSAACRERNIRFSG